MLSLRKTLADSHVAAIAAAVLLLWSMYWAALALSWMIGGMVDPIMSVAYYIATAVAIRGIPAAPPGPSLSDHFTLTLILIELFGALLLFAAAWFLTRWVYGANLFRVLRDHLLIFRRQHV